MARNSWFFTEPKDLKLSRSIIDAEVNEAKKELKIILRSEMLVKDVYLNFPGYEGRFSDNFFDLLPGESRKVTFYPNESDNIPSANDLQIISLNEMLLP